MKQIKLLPNTLIEIQNYLTTKQIALSTPLRDGRINSSFNEDEIIKIIQKRFKVSVPNSPSMV